MRRGLVFVIAILLAGCGSAALRAVRAHLEEGDVAGAYAAAGEDRRALRELSLGILSRALEDADLRPAALRGLEGAGWLAERDLDRMVGHDDEILSSWAASLLLRRGDRRGRELLEERLGHEDGEVRAAAVSGLCDERRDPADYGEWLNDVDERVRRAAVKCFGRVDGIEGDLSLLAEAARRDPDPGVRGAALRGLSRREQGQLLLDVAREALSHSEASVRRSAIAALGHADSKDAAVALLGEVLSRSDQDRLDAVRAAAILASWDDPRGVVELERALSDPSVALASAAVVAASQAGEAMTPALVAALDRDEPEVRRQAASALLRGADRDRAVEVLTDLLARPGWIGAQAALALVKAGEGQALPRLEAALEEEDPRLRAHVASAAARIPGGFDLARRALGDDIARVRVAAASALLHILSH